MWVRRTAETRALSIFLALSLAAHLALVIGVRVPRPCPRVAEVQVVTLVEELSLPVPTVTLGSVTSMPPTRSATSRVEPRARGARSSAPRETSAPEAHPSPVTIPVESEATAEPATSGNAGTTEGRDEGPSRGTAQSGQAGGPRVDDAGAVRAFVADVRARVLAARRYPRAALERGLEGDVLVTVEIVRDGRARVLAVEAANVPASLVTAATDAIREASPFPIPATVQREMVRARFPIRFRVEQ